MDNLQLATFIKCQIRLLERAFEESDGMMVGADRHEVFEYIGANSHIEDQCDEYKKCHRIQNPLEWSEEVGSAKALDPIKNEIDSMKELVKTLKGEK